MKKKEMKDFLDEIYGVLCDYRDFGDDAGEQHWPIVEWVEKYGEAKKKEREEKGL